MAETPIRKIRIDNDTWQRIQNEAARTGETASNWIRRTLITVLEKNQ